MAIRAYRPEDAAACYRLRREAFLGVFRESLTEDAAMVGADSFSPSEFAARIGDMQTLVATSGGEIVGFCTTQMLSEDEAELLYLYIEKDHRGLGIGSRLVHQAEQLAASSCSVLRTIVVTTAVPDYNKGFWERMGYRSKGTTMCDYPTGKLTALRLEKNAGHQT
jgi:GNAT superfamily N-acetyltransferase